MAHFLIGGAAAQLEARDRDRALQQYQYERNMDRLLANDAYARQMGEERWNYSRMDNDRQYRFNRDKFNWQKQNADFLNRRLEENDNRAAAKRWADGLTPQDMQEIFRGPRSTPQEILERYDADRPGWLPAGRTMPQLQYRSQADVDQEKRMRYSRDPEARARAGEAREYGFERNSPFAETIRHYSRFGVTSPERAEALRLRRAADERAALNYERQQQAAQQKHDWAMEAATGTALRQAQSAEAKAQEQRRYNQAVLEIQSELGKYALSEGIKPEAATKAVYDIVKENGVSVKEAVRELARVYGWAGGDEAETAAAQENQSGGRPVGPGVSLNSKAGSGKQGGLPGGTHGQTRTGTEGTDEHGSGVDGHGLSKEGTDGGVGTKEYRRADDLYRGNVARIDNARERLRKLATGAFRAQTQYQMYGNPIPNNDTGPYSWRGYHSRQKAAQKEYEQLLQEIKKLEAENLELKETYQRIGNPQAGFRRIKPNDTKR